MNDRFGREIDYMRISITDKCNLRCKYCMPCSLPNIPHDNILRYEELLRICRAAVTLGINRFKVTGGEPLVRKGAVDFIARLKAEPGVQNVTLTTNGTLLSGALPGLITAGVDGVNISLDVADPEEYRALTGADHAKDVLEAIAQCEKSGIRTKVNCVMYTDNVDQYVPLAMLARDMAVDVRFIELMPIGHGRAFSGPDGDTLLMRLQKLYPDLQYVDEKRGNGPAVYYKSALLKGHIGFIGANSHQFCSSCNRVRITSTGELKPCLCYEATVDLRTLIRDGATDAELVQTIADAVYNKPAAHCFSEADDVTEYRMMNQIGG